jgi:hypothetical protein
MGSMTGAAWLFFLVTTGLAAWACWMAFRGMTAPHPGFREGGHAPGASGSFAHGAAPQAAPPPPEQFGDVA